MSAVDSFFTFIVRLILAILIVGIIAAIGINWYIRNGEKREKSFALFVGQRYSVALNTSADVHIKATSPVTVEGCGSKRPQILEDDFRCRPGELVITDDRQALNSALGIYTRDPRSVAVNEVTLSLIYR